MAYSIAENALLGQAFGDTSTKKIYELGTIFRGKDPTYGGEGYRHDVCGRCRGRRCRGGACCRHGGRQGDCGGIGGRSRDQRADHGGTAH
jgi:hypothetical protein